MYLICQICGWVLYQIRDDFNFQSMTFIIGSSQKLGPNWAQMDHLQICDENP